MTIVPAPVTAAPSTLPHVTSQPPFDAQAVLAHDGPLSREAAMAALDRAAELMETADFADAGRLYNRVIGFDDPGVTAAALLGLGQALNRLDDEPGAMGAWEEVTRLPRTPATYQAWRELAAARVRHADLPGAMAAYKEADKLAPAEDRPEIASRLGWLSKQLGDTGAAGRYFSKARGGEAGFPVTPILVAVTVVVSLVASFGGPDGGQLLDILALDKVAIAHGEIWRLWTVVLVHAPIQQDPLHLLFNMYMLWIIGPVVERLYGRWRFLLLYAVFALGGSLMTFAIATDPVNDRFAVGASGAIFGLVGLVVAAGFVHRPLLSNMRGFAQQLVLLIVLNLALGFTGQGIDNWAHIGGLVAGLWTGVLLAPTAVPTLRSMWMRKGANGAMAPAFGAAGNRGVRVAGFLLLAAFLVLLWTMGIAAWS